MSLSNFLFDKIIKNKCNHKEKLNKNISYNKPYYYCYKCNNIILIDNGKTYCTSKLILDEDDPSDKIEFDPISIVKLMIERQEEQIKDINEKLVLNYSNNDDIINFNQINSNFFNESEKSNYFGILNSDQSEKIDNTENEKIKNIKKLGSDLMINSNSGLLKDKKNNKFTKLLFDEEIFDKYAKNRNKILIYIHKLCTKLKYNDSSFYLSLYLLDTYLSRIFSDDITERELFLVVLGFFLISSKFIEDDIFEPELQIFCNIEKSISLTMEEIRASEVQCLTLINYNMYLYSSYDWLNILLSNGILFENEIKDMNELGNIYIYTQKLLTLITSKIYFCRFSSLQIAFSIVQLSREKYLNKNLEISEKLYKLLISLYGIEFSDYEECYNIIKKDLIDNENNDEDNEEESLNSNIDTTKSNTNTNKTIKSTDIILTKDNKNILTEERNISNLNSSGRKNKFKVYLNSNKGKKYMNTDYNVKLKINKNSKNKYKIYSSPGQINFLNHKKNYKSSDRNYEYLQNNSIGIFNENCQNLSPNIMSHNNSLSNTSFKSTNFIPKDPQHLIIDCYRNDKQLILSGKNQKNNNTLYINYAPKLLIKNTGPNINNINYINNININNEVINLYSGNKSKKLHKNISSGLNFNFCYNINSNNNKNNNNNENKSNNYIVKNSLITIGNSDNNQINIINNVNKMNINNKNKNKKDNNNIRITSSQNMLSINNAITSSFNNLNKMDSNNKEKYKTHLLLDMTNNPNGNMIYNRNDNNQIIIPVEKENKSCNKYTFSEYNNININNNNNKSKTKFRLHLGKKKEIKVMNTNININLNNKFNNRKFTINFKDIVNKKINMERGNNFISKDSNSKMKRFKSLNSNNYIINTNNKNKTNKKEYHNINKSKNDKKNIKMDNKNKINNIKNDIIRHKNLDIINSGLPKLKFIKNLLK